MLKIGATAIEQVEEAGVLFQVTNTMIAATELGSAAEQSYAGISNFGTVEFSGFADPSATGQAALLAAAISRANTTVINGELADTAGTIIATTGPIESYKITGGGANTLAKFACVQRVNSYTIGT